MLKKTNNANSAITDAKVLKAKPEIVKDAVEVRGSAARQIKSQVDGDGIANGNPKKRSKNYSGRDEA
jgi:hypothetical protein